jgi:hypothetical protein
LQNGPFSRRLNIIMKYFLLISFFLISVSNYSFGQKSIPKDTLIILERLPGFWGRVIASSCSFCKLSISANGKVQLEPKARREQQLIIGKIIKSRISRQQVKQLISEFEAMDFYSLNSTFEPPGKHNPKDCPLRADDSTSAILSINMNGKTKVVEHYHGCLTNESSPDLYKLTSIYKLTKLEDKIDEILNLQEWFDCKKGIKRIKQSR